MALVFPSNPTVGQTHTDGTRSWKWTGARWQSVQASPLAHASTHATGGADAISPADIGAAAIGVLFNGTFVPYVGTTNGKSRYYLIVRDAFGQTEFDIAWTGTIWYASQTYSDASDGYSRQFYSATGNTDYPWQATWTGYPVNYSPATILSALTSHSHVISDVSGLQTALNSKANAAPVYQIFDHIVAGTTNLINQSAFASGGGSMSSSTRLYNSIGVATLTTSSTLSAAYSVVGINPAAGVGNNTAKAVDLALGDRNVHSTRSAFFALPSAATTGLWFSGFLDIWERPTNGAYFRVLNGGNLQCVCANNGVETIFNYGSVPTSGMHLYEVVVRNFGTAVDFFYDSTRIATLTTNIPTGTTRRVNYGVGVAKNSTAVAGSIEIDLDLIYLRLGSYSGVTLNI